jgi:CBS domain-containing protein
LSKPTSWLQARGPQLLSTPVSEVMTRSPRTCAPGLKAIDAMQARCALVHLQCQQAMRWLDGGCFVGAPLCNTTLSVVSRYPPILAAMSRNLLLQAMEDPTKVTFLPVVEDGRLQGLISLHGLVSAGL